MAKLDNLPPEILCVIAEECEVAALYGKNPGTKYRYHAHLARACRRLHQILNPLLYQRHIRNDPPLDCCILWAAETGSLGTMKVAHRFGASLDTNGTRDSKDLQLRWDSIPGRRRYFATPLHFAIRNNHQQIVDYLLENGANPHVPSRDFASCDLPFVLECAAGLESKRKLVKHGATLLRQNQPALPVFASRGYESDFLCLFLDHHDTELTSQALRCAAQYNIPELFYGALSKPELNASNPDTSDGKTALHYAASSGNKAFVEELLARSDVDVTAQDKKGQTPLLCAATCGVTLIVDLLLKQPGVDILATDKSGCTILHYACEADGDTANMRLLIERLIQVGVDVNHSSQTGTALFHALKHGNLHTALFLISNGADPTVGRQVDKSGWTMLHHSLYKKERMEIRTQLVREIVSRGANLEHDAEYDAEKLLGKDLENEWMYLGPPLHFAAAYAESVECMKILIDAGADPSNGALCVGHDDADTISSGDVHPALCALFQICLFEKCPVQRRGNIEQLRERVCLLLDHGYSLDFGGTGNSAGCPLVWAERLHYPQAVKLILDYASSKNITFGHLMHHVRQLENDDRTESQEIWRMLVDFRQREYLGYESDEDQDYHLDDCVQNEEDEEEEEED